MISKHVTGVTAGYPDGLRFRVAFAGGLNTRFAEVFGEEMAPYMTAIAADALTEETANRLLSRIYVRSIIIEWESDVSEDQPPPLSEVEAAAKWLRTHSDVFEDMQSIATDPMCFGGTDGESSDVRPADCAPGG